METMILDLPEIEGLINSINKKYANFKYGWYSNDTKKYDFGHWNKLFLQSNANLFFDYGKLPFIKNYPEVEKIWDIIQSKIGKRQLVRVYINGYTYGTDAYFHQDDAWIAQEFGKDAASETTIIYLNQVWHPDWAGETVILNENNDVETAVLPKKNRALIFDSLKLHAARPLSRACPAFRKVLVFKTASCSIPAKEMDFIYNLTLNDPELFDLSFKMSMSYAKKYLCLAALYHAVYTYPNIDRKTVRNLIGSTSEQIVYDYHNGTNPDSIDIMRINLEKLAYTNINNINLSQINEINNKISKKIIEGPFLSKKRSQFKTEQLITSWQQEEKINLFSSDSPEIRARKEENFFKQLFHSTY